MQFIFVLLLALASRHDDTGMRKPAPAPFTLNVSISQEGATVKLRWRGPMNPQGCCFTIERKLNGRFYTIDSVTGSGSQDYIYTEKYPSAGTHVYRIRCLQKGQTSLNSDEKSINISAADRLIVSGSPGSSSLVVFHTIAGQHERIVLFNKKDQEINSYQVIPGRTFTTVSLPGVAPGLHYLGLVRPGTVIYYPIVID
ncbi:hypothetical protein LZZ85_04600 [Terrimonas sp. NA20]|uniref:Fibronectin type-III domain-containing protein n=1 Tax=Terrimonas ginsenosidimutans TaxID=2908004 RepID=A0ABS9KMK4_9BACT|nr:hypothetical protein [Terrimonas ginsenosidimutans]MCG2613544.1 hypothetical protein [Terrimonas ginsenosidimutans]